MEAIVWAINQSKSSGFDKLVLILLADFYSETERCAWPSIGTLAAKAGVCENSVRSSLKTLEKSGEIKIEVRRHAEGMNRSNRYHFPLFVPHFAGRTAPDEVPPTAPDEVPHPSQFEPDPVIKTYPVNKPKEEKSARKLATLCPDVLPTELWQWAQAQGLEDETAYNEWDKMRDWSHSNGEKKLDWAATWRNWIRRGKEKSNGKRPESFAERNARESQEGYGRILEHLDKVLQPVGKSLPESTVDDSGSPSLFGSALGPEPGATGNGLRRRN